MSLSGKHVPTGTNVVLANIAFWFHFKMGPDHVWYQIIKIYNMLAS